MSGSILLAIANLPQYKNTCKMQSSQNVAMKARLPSSLTTITMTGPSKQESKVASDRFALIRVFFLFFFTR
jgi:hypothetical protein